MNQRGNIAAVTFDAYSTLLDFSSDIASATGSVLGAIGAQCDNDALRRILGIMDRVVVRELDRFVNATREHFPDFVSLYDIHRAMFVEVERTVLPGIDVNAATDAWNRYISAVPLYEDARPAVEWCAERWPVAIVSDIDTWMLVENPILRELPIRGVVTSEDEKTYKAMADSTMFDAAGRLLGVAPETILHVGDSSADVIGIKRAGGYAVWLNRKGAKPHDAAPVPDAEITTLTDLPVVIERIQRNGG